MRTRDLRFEICDLRPGIVMACLLFVCATALGQGQSSVVNSPHNLSTLGPGKIRAAGEQEICIFCHTPHHAAPTIQPLWNRYMPVDAYRVYSSNSLQAKPGQPTGNSKLCLSCHDGTIALGSVLARNIPIAMAGGITTLPPGASNLGTDLRDDHPISFTYDAQLVQKNPKLKDPATLSSGVHLDSNRELQCTSCHDAHNNQYGKFLVVDNTNSQLCNSCHLMGTTTVPNHVECNSCHQQHTAPSGPYLLRAAKVSDTCLRCHNGATPPPPQGPNIAADLTKLSIHDTSSAINLADPFPANVNCADCHGPHTMTNTLAVAPNVPGRFGQVSGVNAAGGVVAAAQFEYQVCFKCHADKSAVAPRITRTIVQTNLRLKVDQAAISFHPIESAGRNPNVPSLRPGLTVGSMIYCNDCHNSETGQKAGGSGPNGVHGSGNAPLLVAGYNTTDGTAESDAAYALCYRCHDRTKILSESGPFPLHKKHVQEEKTPCSVCHDPHGISSAQGTTQKNSHLINFDTTVVLPSQRTGRLEYNSTGPNSGTCFLNCHGEEHNGPPEFVYPEGRSVAPMAKPAVMPPAFRLPPAAPRPTPKKR